MAADTTDNDRITVAHLAQSALTSEFTWSDAVLLSLAEDPRHQETQRQAQPEEQHGIAVQADDQHQSLHSAFDLQATSPFHRYGTIAHNQIDAGPSGSTTGRRLDGHSSPPVPSSSPLYDPLSYDSFLELRFPESSPFESEPTTLSLPVAQHPARALGATTTTTITTREAIESLRSLADLEAPYSSPTPTAPQQHGSAAPDSHSCRGPSTSRQHCFAPSLWEWTDMDSSSSAMENRQPFEGDADEECISPASQHQPLNLDMALSSSPPKSQTYAASAETSAVPQSSAQATARTNRCIPSMGALAPRVYTGVSQNLQRPVTMNQASTSLERSSSGSSSSLSGQQTHAQSSWNLSAMPPPRMYASSEAVQPKDGYAAWHMGQARLAAGVSAASPTVESAQGSPDSASLSSTAQRGSGGGSAVPETKVSPSGLVASAAIAPSSTIPLNEGTRPWNPSATTLGRMMPSSSSSSSLLALTPFEVMGSQLRDLDEEFSQSDAAATAMAGGGEKPYMLPSPTHIGAGATLPGGEEGMTPSDEQIRYMAAVGTGREEQSTGIAVGKMPRKSSTVDEAGSSAQHKSSKGMLSKVDLTKGSANHHPRAKASTNRPESMYESAQAALEDMVGYHQSKVKPTQPYPNLIRLTLLTSATGKLCLSELYEAMADNFPWFKTQGMGWKNSIRHNLSINSSFLRIERSGKDDKSKGSLWFVDTQVEPASVRPPKTTPSGRGGIRAPRSKLVSAAEAELRRENEDDDEDHSELDQDAEGETDSEQGGAGEPTGGHRITNAGQDDSQMAETATDVADKVAVKHEDPEAGNLASFSSQQAGPSSIRMQDTGSTGARRTSYSLMATHQKKTPTRGQLGMSTAAATDPKPRTRSGAQKRCREDSSQGSSQGRGHGHGHEHARPPIPPSPHFIVVPHTIATGPATAPVMDSRSSTRGHQVEMHSPFMPMQMDSSPAPSGSSLPRLIPFGMMGAPVTAPIAMGVASESSYLFGSTSPLPFMTGPFTTTATLPRFWEASRCPACGRWRAECICHMSAFQQGALMGQQQQQQPQQQELPSPAFCSYPMPLQHSQSVPRGMATAFPATPARRHHPYTHPGAGFGTSANGSASTSSGNSGPLQYSSSSSSSASPYGNLAEGSARSVPLSIGQPYRTAESQMPPPPPLPSPERGAVRDGNLSLSSSVAAGSSQSGTGYPGSSLTSLWYPSSSPWATTPQDGAGQIPAGGVPESPSENAKRSKMARQSASSSSSSSSSLPPLSIGALVDTASAEDTAARDLLALRTGSGGADPMSAGSVGVADDDAAPGTGTAVGEHEQAEMSS